MQSKSNKSKIMLDTHQNFFKIVTLLDIFLCHHFNSILIMGSYAKWLIWTLKNSKNSKKKNILGFGFNKKTLELEQ